MQYTPPGDDFALWLPAPAHRKYSDPDAIVELWRAEWGNDTHFARVADMPPALNVVGLWWRTA